MIQPLLERPLRILSAGAALFSETLAGQGVTVEQVEWRERHSATVAGGGSGSESTRAWIVVRCWSAARSARCRPSSR